MSKTVNVAMIGLGFGGEFIPIYQAHPNTNVIAICRRNEDELIGELFSDIEIADVATTKRTLEMLLGKVNQGANT